MQDEKMCIWVGQKVCKFSSLRESDLPNNFKKEYCFYCLKGQQIDSIKHIENKINTFLMSVRK